MSSAMPPGQRPPWPGPPPWGAPPWGSGAGPSRPPEGAGQPWAPGPYPSAGPPPPWWGGYGPAAPPRAVHTRPQPYHRLLRTTTYRWWRPLLGLPLAALAWILLTVGLTLPVLAGAALFGGSVDDLLDPGEPSGLLLTNLLLAALIPAMALAVFAVHREKVGWLSSVTARVRWRLLGVLALVALGVVAVTMGLSFLVPEAEGTDDGGGVEAATVLATVVIVLLTTPLQAAGEEYAFRGYLSQALGCWVRSPWVGGVFTALLFAAAHGGQDVWLFADRFAFGLVASWLVWRTGGLEAAIAYHAVGNMVVLVLAALGGDLGSTLEVTDIPFEYLLIDVVGMVGFAWLATRVARRQGAATRSAGLEDTAATG